jgi:hypothetical protein
MKQVFWVLWLQDVLLPCLILRVMWSLIRRGLYPYPTLAELRQRRKEIARSKEFGESITARLTKTSKFGVRDAWKVFQDFRSLSDVNIGMGSTEGNPPAPSTRVLDRDLGITEAALKESPSEQDLLMIALLFLNAVADVHERIRKRVTASIIATMSAPDRRFQHILVAKAVLVSSVWNGKRAYIFSTTKLLSCIINSVWPCSSSGL